MAANAPRLHALTWTVWMLAAAVCAQATTNPLYLTIILFIAVLIVEVHGRRHALAKAFPIMLALATAFGLIRVVLTVLTTHGTGSTTLLTLPIHFALPNALGGFTVFGTIEQEPLVRSIFEAYGVVVFIATFAAWNAVVSHHEVMRAIPRAFHEPALVVTIAIAFVPSTIATLRAVHLADRARCGGNPVRRGRVRRLIIPVVEGGLERAIALAESMESRGLGHMRASRAERRAGWCSLLGLAALCGAIVALTSQAKIAATMLALCGATLLGAATRIAASGYPRTRYRARPLRATDLWLLSTSVLALALVVLTSVLGDRSLAWSPQPLAWPTIGIGPLLAFGFLVVPAFTAPASVDSSSSTFIDIAPTPTSRDSDTPEPSWAQ